MRPKKNKNSIFGTIQTTNMALKKYLKFLLLLSVMNSFSQYTDIINSNRPGQSKSAFAVGKNVAQLEIGFYNFKNKHDILNSENKGFGLNIEGRYGFLFEQLELNFNAVYQNETVTQLNTGSTYKQANFKMLSFGAKYLIYDPYKNRDYSPNLYSYKANRRFNKKDLIPAVGIQLSTNYDAKENPYSYNPYTQTYIEGFSPNAAIYTQHNFRGGWVFISNFIMNRIGTNFDEFQYIFTLTKSINEAIVLFAETQGIKSDVYGDNLFRFGGAYLLNRNLQFDTDLTLNTKNTPSIFTINAGISYRLDFHVDKEILTEDNIDEEFMENEMERLNKVSKKEQKKIDKQKKKELKKANKTKGKFPSNTKENRRENQEFDLN